MRNEKMRNSWTAFYKNCKYKTKIFLQLTHLRLIIKTPELWRKLIGSEIQPPSHHHIRVNHEWVRQFLMFLKKTNQHFCFVLGTIKSKKTNRGSNNVVLQHPKYEHLLVKCYLTKRNCWLFFKYRGIE